jgi:hypothetical protein
MVRNEIKSKDEAVLKHLTKMECRDDDELSFTIIFVFEENDFFLNN